jgi:hypothetical protein
MSEEKQTNWLRDIFLVPLIVALVAAAATYGIPKLFEVAKRISYTIEKQISFKTDDMPDVVIQVNGTPAKQLFDYKVRIWNSGGLPLKDILLLFHFETTDQGFAVLNIQHHTKPLREFGKISEPKTDKTFEKYVQYELLNPEDEDSIDFLTNQEAALAVYGKQEGLKIVEVNASPWYQNGSLINVISALGVFAVTLLALVFSTISKLFSDREKLRELELAEKMRLQAEQLANESEDLKIQINEKLISLKTLLHETDAKREELDKSSPEENEGS